MKVNSKRALQIFIIQRNCSLPLGMVWHSFDATVSVPNYCQACWSKKLVLGHIIIALLRSGSAGEYLVLGFCIGPPYGWANTASLEPNILLYCPPTCAIIYIYIACTYLYSGTRQFELVLHSQNYEKCTVQRMYTQSTMQGHINVPMALNSQSSHQISSKCWVQVGNNLFKGNINSLLAVLNPKKCSFHTHVYSKETHFLLSWVAPSQLGNTSLGCKWYTLS